VRQKENNKGHFIHLGFHFQHLASWNLVPIFTFHWAKLMK